MKKLELYIDEDVFQKISREIYYKELLEQLFGTVDETMLLILRAMVSGQETLRIQTVKTKKSHKKKKEKS